MHPGPGATPVRTPATIPNAILVTLRTGGLVLTATQRAARTLRNAFDQAMQAEGRASWVPPEVLALDTWMPTLWHRMLLSGDESRLLLNRTQEHSLWRAILAADPDLPGLRSSDSLAEMAARAWHLTFLHNGNARLREFGVSTDTRAFERWAREFDRRLNRGLFLSAAQLPAALTSALAAGTLPLPETGLTLVDFDVLPPAHDVLFDSIHRAGFPVEHLHSTLPPASLKLHAAGEDTAELHAAAYWIRAQLDTHPHTRIAVVVPALAERRAEIERIFSDVLTPASTPITAPAARPTFEFSLGLPLANTALCADALDLLRWSMQPLPLASLSGLLLSPFFGGVSSETLSAAEFDAVELRRQHLLRPELTLAGFIDLLKGSRRGPQLPGLLHRCRSMHKLALPEQLDAASHRAERTFGEWSDAFRSLLDASGWSDASKSDSTTFQTRQRWESALDEAATLDFAGARVTAASALQQLARIAARTIFAPQSTGAPVQVLGPLEVGGVPFDSLWFLGADDLSWPQPAAAHPLLPWAMQRALGMPGTDASRDTAQARRLTQRLAASATNVVFSYAMHAEEGTRRPAPLVTALRPATLEAPALATLRTPSPLESVPDTAPIHPLPDRVLLGGASILELQAACPFMAFAERRLLSSDLEARDLGLDLRERGTAVHSILEAFWATARDQATLRAMFPLEREILLDACIDAALERDLTRARSAWDSSYLEVQRQRLRRLLRPWLELELGRPAFAVREREKTLHDVHIGPLRLDIRVDRIDDTAAGALILDYKTGAATTSDWLSDRPDSPQLPLYAVLAEPDTLGGLAFALLRPGKDLDLTGFADSPAALRKPAKMPLPLPDQVDEWRTVLTALATDFASGEASVTPKCYPQTCKRCSQRILCRLDVSSLDQIDDEEDAEASFAENDLA